MTNNNVLIINGRHYDAETGKLLASNDQPITKARSMDGVTQPKKPKASDLPKPPLGTSRRSGRAHDIILSKTIHARSTTKPLMRTGLKKPTKITKPTQHPQAIVGSKQADTEIKLHHNAARVRRAEAMHRAYQVKHFSKHHSSESRRWGVSSSLQSAAVAPAKIIDSIATQTNKLQSIVDKGLQKASSHDQPEPIHAKRKPKKSKIRVFNTVIGALAVLVILGFAVYKSLPYIDVRIAATQSGVHAEIPGYIPAGFKFDGPIKYGQGFVTVIFNSKTASIRIIQENSNWDSVSLRDSFVSTVDPNYKVVQAGGRIVYLYGKGDATWVNAGIWYQITDNANLSATSLLRIATSL